MRLPLTLDLHVPNFNFANTPPDALFDRIVEIAQTIERSGFSSISVMDHLHQIGPVGPPQNYMLEGSTTLAAIAARTQTLTLGLLVGSVTYRNPALAAKITSTVDIISGGRAWHGIGAGWFEEEHVAYGFDFPPLKERFERLEEALRIARSMFTGEEAAFAGTHFRIEHPYNNPLPLRGDIPILVGGSGERKTLRLVARYADGCNLFGDAERVTHLLGVLRAHCDDVGRDYDEITKTGMASIIIAPTHEAAEQKVRDALAAGTPQARVDTSIVGDPDTVGERIALLAGAGLEGLTVTTPDNSDLEALELIGRTLAPLFPARV